MFRYFKSQWGFPLKNDLEFNDLIDLNILKMKDAGIHNSVMRRYDEVEAVDCQKRQKGSSLNLFATIFIFIILLFGIVLSSFLFVMELVWSTYIGKEKDQLKTIDW